jgi:hypothetical protein
MSSTNSLGSTLPTNITSIKATGSILNLQIVSQLVTHLRTELNGLNLNDLKFSPSFIQNILSKIETVVNTIDNSSNTTTLDLAVKVINQLIPNSTTQDNVIIKDIIDFIIDNKLVVAIENETKSVISSVEKILSFKNK